MPHWFVLNRTRTGADSALCVVGMRLRAQSRFTSKAFEGTDIGTGPVKPKYHLLNGSDSLLKTLKAVASLRKRFEAHIDRTSSLDGCWLWTGACVYVEGVRAYGRIALPAPHSRIKMAAHRVSYELYKGPILNGDVLDHLCAIKQCVNPDHLEAVSMRTNTLRGPAPNAVTCRRQACQHGHDLSQPENVTVYKDGRRRCRLCIQERRRRRG